MDRHRYEPERVVVGRAWGGDEITRWRCAVCGKPANTPQHNVGDDSDETS